MALILLGISYRTAPVPLREQLAIPSHALPEWLRDARAALDLDEIVILSTCNRTEWCLVSDDPNAAADRLLEWLSARRGISPALLQRACYRLADGDAVAHICRVTAGLDSMILGESEVTAQVKQAYTAAHDAGTAGPLLHRVFQKALHCAKLIRSETRISHGSASIGSVVVKLARELFGERLGACDGLLWGAGKAAEATTKHLAASGIGKLWIVNRTQEKAQQLAALCRGGWLSWERALRHLAAADIAIVCTEAPHFVIDRDDLLSILPARGGRPLCLIDLALPRNIDPAAAELPGVRLYGIDDLNTVAQSGLFERRQEMDACEALISQQVGHALRWRATPSSNKESRTCREPAVL